MIHPRTTRLRDVAEHQLCRPEHQTYVLERIHDADGNDETFEHRVAAALREAGADAVVIAGERLAEHPLATDVALSVAQRFGARFAYVTRRANDRGALRAGLHPALLPGGRRVSNDVERGEVEAVWGRVGPADPGGSARQILEACDRREIDVLFLVGVDPLRDFPDATLARRALANVRYKVVQGLELGDLEPYADAFLPAAAWSERDGHVTDWEGRSQPIRPVRGPVGLSRPDWEIFAGLAEVMGGDLGFGSLDELREEAAGLLAPRVVPERSTAWTGTGRPQLLGDLTLFSYPLLVDEGRLLEGAGQLRSALEDPAFAEMHPDDAEKRGVQDGGRVRLKTETGELDLPVRITRDVAAGAIFVPFNQPGSPANAVLAGGFIEPASIEAIEAVEASTEGVA